jgi:hypothetical protein
MSQLIIITRPLAIWLSGFAAALFLVADAQAHGGDPTLIHSCVNKSSGALRITAPTSVCAVNESPFDWRSAEGSAPATAQSPKVYINKQDYFTENRIWRFLETPLPAGTYLVIAKGNITSVSYGACNLVSGEELTQTYHNSSFFDNGTKSLAQVMIAKVTLASPANVAMRCGNPFGDTWTITQPVLVATPVAPD